MNFAQNVFFCSLACCVVNERKTKDPQNKGNIFFLIIFSLCLYYLRDQQGLPLKHMVHPILTLCCGCSNNVIVIVNLWTLQVARIKGKETCIFSHLKD